MRFLVRLQLVFVVGVLCPSLAAAQASITGVVRDTSNLVLPGVTVEATSPVLTEKVRSVVTDGNGQYRIIELLPGTYTVAYELPGFNRVVREGVEVAGSAVFTINAEMRVGGLEETITVIGETPVVDVQSVRRETVLSADVIATIPGTRAVGSLLNATAGLTVDNNGLQATPTMTFFSARGGQTNEGRMTVNGMVVAAAFNGGGVSSYILDSVNADEVSITVSGGLGETDIGGPVMNLIPRAGGNAFRGQAFYNTAGDWSKGNNLNDALRAPAPGPNLRETPGIIRSYDTSASLGGPIKRDRVWFFGSYRKLDTSTAVEGIVANANAYDASRWDWRPDNAVTSRQLQGREMFIGRVTAQVSPKHRLSFNHEYQLRCEGSPLKVGTEGCHTRGANWIASGAALTSPEATTNYFDFPYFVSQALWTAPMTNKLLLEAGFTRFSYYHAGGPGQLAPDGIFDIGVTEQSAAINPATGIPYAPRANYVYRALSQYSDNYGNPNNWRASASYVTGSHNMKVGYQGAFLRADTETVRNASLLNYRFNQGVPNQFTFALPWQTADRTSTAALYVQDSWTRGRMTLQGALRYDRAWSWSNAEHNGSPAITRLNPTLITFERTPSVQSYNDLTPRIGVAYDVFGNGRTAVKFNMGHYLDAATNDSAYTRNNPAGLTVRTVNRAWADTNGNRVVDCNLLDFAAQSAVDTCAVVGGNDLNFGRLNPATTVNPETLKGWGVRENDWQWGVNVQHQIVPRVSLEVGYNRRWWHGFTVTDNALRSPSDYQAWTITAPSDPRLPGGGGYPIALSTVSAAANAIAARSYITFESDFGPERINYWHGADVTLNARFRSGLTLQAGTSSGREVENSCATAPLVDPANNVTQDVRNCRDVDPFQTTLRGLASYTIPKIGLLVSGTLRSQPPNERVANWVVPNTVIQQQLGRLPPAALATGNTTINVLDNDHRLYEGNRRTQVDMRFAKIVRLGDRRLDMGADLGNLLNANYTTTYENTYQYSVGNTLNGGTWDNPTAIYNPRFVRLNVTFNF